MKLILKIWRQKDSKAKGSFVTYKMDNVSQEMSFLEMLDALNKTLIEEDKEPVAFDHDCREG
ncbi:MAG: 2Fe-2S iron-sulfur cluster-binding protein, partial [Bacteroidia bacterium]|nr:2Fe-2S iron-sulfur cluster-binding protein [Bacteroidia bacterium]